MFFMADGPLQPINRDAVLRLQSLLRQLAEDCDELTAAAAGGKKDGVHHGVSKARELTVVLQSLLAGMSRQ
jgi:hypothetical protein